MPFWRLREKKLKMVWRVEQQEKPSFLIGTAHFFPYSFRSSLRRYLKGVDTVLFEGPLDQEAEARVLQAGLDRQGEAAPLFALLDAPTIGRINKIMAPSPREARALTFSPHSLAGPETAVKNLLQGLKPWMAFFTIWTSFLGKQGWSFSVDLEAYTLARELGREIHFLESIEEQLAVLETLSLEKIVNFLRRIKFWEDYLGQYTKCYLAGNLAQLERIAGDFPSRTAAVIEGRDRVFFERMRGHLTRGGVAACVGAPHIAGIRRLLHADGYATRPDHA